MKKGYSEEAASEYDSAGEFLALLELSCCLQQWLRSEAEEADQSLDVLGSCREEELLANKL